MAAWVLALFAFHGDIVVMSTAFLAFTLGLRHAVDADHIAAKLLERPSGLFS
jgi:high-affinity nickel-transport protein